MILILPIKKRWLDMIINGEKKEDYREHKEYWGKRFAKILGYLSVEKLDREIQGLNTIGRSLHLDVVFRNGYSSKSPSCKAKVSLSIGTGREEWGAEAEKEYYKLKIMDVQNES